MGYTFYAIHWIQYDQDKIKWTDDSLYYTRNTPYDLDEMKDFLRLNVIKDPAAVLTIQNIKEITREKFEEFGGPRLN